MKKVMDNVETLNVSMPQESVEDRFPTQIYSCGVHRGTGPSPILGFLGAPCVSHLRHSAEWALLPRRWDRACGQGLTPSVHEQLQQN